MNAHQPAVPEFPSVLRLRRAACLKGFHQTRLWSPGVTCPRPVFERVIEIERRAESKRCAVRYRTRRLSMRREARVQLRDDGQKRLRLTRGQSRRAEYQ